MAANLSALALALALVLSLSITACARHPPLTPVSAETLAARLANDQCYRQFGERPFKAEDYAAELTDGRWHWGTENGGPVDGYEIEVSFARDGGDKHIVIRGRDRE